MNNFNRVFVYSYYRLEFIFPGKILWNICDWNQDRFKNIIPSAADNNDLFCFDHTKTRDGIMPIVICKVKSYLEPQVVAGSFEEFIDMLYEPED